MRIVCLTASLALLWIGTAYAGDIEGTLSGKSAKYYRNSVVYIEQVDCDFELPEKHPRVDQKKMKFIPHVLPISVGTTVDFHNNDNVNHNVFSPDAPGGGFNLGTWGKGKVKPHTFTEEGVATLLCNVHPEMLGFIVVLQNPYFCLTDKEGEFTIEDIPAGNYILNVWREKGKAITKKVTVPEDGTLTIDLG